MKRPIIIAIAFMAFFMQGCIVLSVHPFFKEKDLVYKKELEGTWTDPDGNSWRIHKNPLKVSSYELHYSKNGREVSLLGHLFNLNGTLYLDMIPIEDNSEEALIFDLHMVPTHSIAKISVLDDHNVEIKWFDEKWLRNMFDENRIKISHELLMEADPMTKRDGLYLLTASTEELQKFIIKYGKDEKAYDSEVELRLTK